MAIGACMFTLVSQFGFTKADQARVAASVASGVGFIGAGVSQEERQYIQDPPPRVLVVEGAFRGGGAMPAGCVRH